MVSSRLIDIVSSVPFDLADFLSFKGFLIPSERNCFLAFEKKIKRRAKTNLNSI